MSSNLKSVVFFTLCFSFGLALFFSVSEDLSVQRDPASIDGKVFQLTSLSSSQIKNQLVKKIKIQSVVIGEKSLQLSGFSSALCKTYGFIELQFVADGMAVAGEPASMTVKAPCEAGQDPSEMASITIPVEKILAQKSKNADFHFDGFAPRFTFKNTEGEWPRTWVLRSVQFISGINKSKLVRMDQNETGELNNSPDQLVVLEF
jgi:hypothetical protein